MNVVEALGRQIRATPLPEPRPASARFGLRSLLAAGIAVAAVAAAALVLTLSTTNPAPAYAVTVHGHRTATVTLRSISSLGALNRRMEALHLPIRAVPVVRGCRARADVVGRTRRPDGPTTVVMMNPDTGRVISFTVALPRAGRTLILGASKRGFYTHGDVIRERCPPASGSARSRS